MSVQTQLDISNVPFIRGGFPIAAQGTIAQNAARSGAIAPLTVMGKKRVAVGTATADAGNTGDGTFTALALAPGRLPLVGSYNLECIVAVAHGGIFKLEDPNGAIVESYIEMTAGAGVATVVVAANAGFTLTLTDGATDFIVGDKCAITFTAVNKWYPIAAAALDGSAIPQGIYLGPSITEAAIKAGDISDAPMLIGSGVCIDQNQLIIEGSMTLATVIDGKTIGDHLAGIGIIAQDTIDISSYEA